MAKIGMEYIVSGLLTEGEDGTPSYKKGRYWGPASTFSMTPTSSDVKDYGDDRVCATDISVNEIALSIELNENSLELESFLLGHQYDAEAKEMRSGRDDIAPYVCVGCVGKSIRDNKMVYRAIFLYKVQVKQPTDDYSTKQETTSFNHSTYEGTAFAIGDEKGSLSIKKEFETLEAAKAWLDTQAGVGVN